MEIAGKLRIFEGAWLQPRHKANQSNTALAAEGILFIEQLLSIFLII
jgi:hypothetical protein